MILGSYKPYVVGSQTPGSAAVQSACDHEVHEVSCGGDGPKHLFS